jgi:hypothetical protein
MTGEMLQFSNSPLPGVYLLNQGHVLSALRHSHFDKSPRALILGAKHDDVGQGIGAVRASWSTPAAPHVHYQLQSRVNSPPVNCKLDSRTRREP